MRFYCATRSLPLLLSSLTSPPPKQVPPLFVRLVIGRVTLKRFYCLIRAHCACARFLWRAQRKVICKKKKREKDIKKKHLTYLNAAPPNPHHSHPARTPTQPEGSVRVQLRGCQGRRPRHRRLVADLQGSVSKGPEEERRRGGDGGDEGYSDSGQQLQTSLSFMSERQAPAARNTAVGQLTDVAVAPSIYRWLAAASAAAKH